MKNIWSLFALIILFSCSSEDDYVEINNLKGVWHLTQYKIDEWDIPVDDCKLQETFTVEVIGTAIIKEENVLNSTPDDCQFRTKNFNYELKNTVIDFENSNSDVVKTGYVHNDGTIEIRTTFYIGDILRSKKTYKK